MLGQRLRHPAPYEIVLVLAGLPALFFLYALVLVPFTPSISDIRKATTERPAQILFADGKKLAEFKPSNRQWVKLAEVSPAVIDALIATEDHRFYTHFGLDWRRTLMAAVNTFRGERQGGSTLTQQLARNLYPEEIGREATLTRKIKEAITALKIEALHSKQEILETYLNTVPFLYNAFGIEMAARTYFDCSARQLDVLQSATLVGMLKGNSYYNPVQNPERAVERRNTVLALMLRQHKLSAQQFEQLKKKPLRINFERQLPDPGAAPHFAQQLRKWLILWADRNDYNVYSDGLVVHTTLDSRLQAQANQAVARQGEVLQQLARSAWNNTVWNVRNPLVQTFLRESGAYRAARASGLDDAQALRKLWADTSFMRDLRQQKTMIEAGFLAIDPRSGEVKAWVGGRDFLRDAFDHVQQARRQPGSTFKPFVYGEAFRQGYHTDDSLLDKAVEIRLDGGEVWRPGDGVPPSGRAMSLRDGLVYSKNTITAQLMQMVGPAKVARLAYALGVRQSPLEEVPSLALGTSPVSLKEMVSAYASIAGGGVYRKPVLVTRIEDRKGRVLAEFAPAAGEAAFSPAVAYTLIDVMRGVVERGTGSAIRQHFGLRGDLAGKTGTTQDNADGWFIMMQPQLVAGAWVGFNDNRVTLNSNYWGQGAHSALPMVGHFYSAALRNRLLDASARFVAPEEDGLLQRLFVPLKAWVLGWWSPAPEPAVHPIRRAEVSPDEDDPMQERIDQLIDESWKDEEAAEAVLREHTAVH